MSVQVPIDFPRLTEEEMAKLDYAVMGHAFAVHGDLGRLCDEVVYQAELAARLQEAGLGPVRRELPVTVSFRSFNKTYELDLVVTDKAIYELKVTASLAATHSAQLLNYLLLCNATRGKLVNFRPASVETCFVNTSLDTAQRRQFRINTRRWREADDFESLVVELLRDWGTGLEHALYTQAITHLLGGDERVLRQVPMTFKDRSVGSHRFHLATPDTAFMLTNFTRRGTAHEPQFQRLLDLSPLRQLWWVNISLHELTFVTLHHSSSASESSCP